MKKFLFLFWLVVGIAGEGSAALVRNYFTTTTNSAVIDTNYLIITKVTTNILANGGVIPTGIPVRTTLAPATNSLAQGFYEVRSPLTRGIYVINIDFEDNGSTVYDYTNYLHSGYNTYVSRSITSNEVVTALGFVPGTGTGSGTATNIIGTLTNNTTGNAATASRATIATNSIQDRSFEDLALLGQWEESAIVLTNGDAVDSSTTWMHQGSVNRLNSGYIMLHYGAWTNNSTSGANRGGVKVAFARTMEGLNAGKAGYAVTTNTLTSGSYTYVAGGNVKWVEDRWWMVGFAGTNANGQFEGETSCGVLLYSTNGTNWVEAPSSPYVPFAAASGVAWDVRNVFGGMISKVDTRWYIHYIAYQSFPWPGGGDNTSGYLHYAYRDDHPTNATAWTRGVGHNIVHDSSGTVIGNIGGLGAYKRLNNGAWYAPLGTYFGVSDSPHPTNFIITATHGTAAVDFYDLFEDGGTVALTDSGFGAQIRTKRPAITARQSNVTTGRVETLSVSRAIRVPSSSIQNTNLTTTIQDWSYNLEEPNAVTSRSYLYIKNSGAVGLDGIWGYKSSNATYTNGTTTAIIYDTGQYHGDSTNWYLIATNASHADPENYDVVAITELPSNPEAWLDDGLGAVAGMTAYFSSSTRRTNVFSGTYYGNGAGVTNLNASRLASGTVDNARLDSDLSSWATVTRAVGFDTFAATATSQSLASLLTDETGSGSVVLSNAPTLGVSATIGSAYIGNWPGGSSYMSIYNKTMNGNTEYAVLQDSTTGTTYINSKDTVHVRIGNGDKAVFDANGASFSVRIFATNGVVRINTSTFPTNSVPSGNSNTLDIVYNAIPYTVRTNIGTAGSFQFFNTSNRTWEAFVP